MTIALNVALRNARADQITVARDAGAAGGNIRIYDGTRPATGGSVTTLLAELTLADPSSPSASSGVLTANSITGDTSADNTGTATWFREVDSNAVFVMDGDVGVIASGDDLELNTVSIVSGLPVDVTSNVITEGNA